MNPNWQSIGIMHLAQFVLNLTLFSFVLLSNFLVLINSLEISNVTDVCQLPSCNGTQNIACNNTGNFSDKCPRYRHLINMKYFKKYLVLVHNDKRNTVAGGNTPGLPPAAHMPDMAWHEELARLADYHIKTCNIEQKLCAATESFENPGHNIGEVVLSRHDMTYSNAFQIQEIVEHWLEELWTLHVIDIDYYPKERSTLNGIYNIANILNERNLYLGCAGAHIFGYIKNYYLLVCYYSTSNIANSPIYTPSKWGASECGLERNKDFPYLCKSH